MIEHVLPHDRRGIFHKKLIGLALDIVSGGGGGGRSGGRFRPGPMAGRLGFDAAGKAQPPCTGFNVGMLRDIRGVCQPVDTRGEGLGSTQVVPLPDIDPSVVSPAERSIMRGEVVMGGFGVPAMVPDIVGRIARRDGSQGPILRCIAGMVLATDNLCYSKGIRGLAAFRKWKPEPRGFLPRKDVVCLRRAIAIKKSKSNRQMLRELGMG